VAGCHEHVNDLLGSLKGRELLYQLSDNQLLKNDSAAWSWLIRVSSLILTATTNTKIKTETVSIIMPSCMSVLNMPQIVENVEYNCSVMNQPLSQTVNMCVAGCGKTTQVAQFILDDSIMKDRGSTCHIVCTQPRRISATSVAARVADERDEVCGEESVGYQIRLERLVKYVCVVFVMYIVKS
jgi:hypothetical protein